MLVFNELSVQNLEGNISKDDVYNAVENFLQIYKEIRQELGYVVYTYDDIKAIMIGDTPLSAWYVDKGVDKDIQRLYGNLCDKQNIFPEELEQEVFYKGESGKGLLIAHSNGGICLSFNINSEYNKPILECMHKQISDKANEIVDTSVAIKNVSQKEHIDSHRKYIDKCNEIDTVEKLLVAIKETEEDRKVFPNLEFIDKAIAQIEQNVPKSCVRQIVTKLRILNDYFGCWNCSFDYKKVGVKCVYESDTNLQKFKDKYTFNINGNDILVGYHIYTFKKIIDGRIYFHPCADTGKGYICSLTRKIENQ